MARKDALIRLTSRLIARRDALRKALDGDLDSFRKFSELNSVGDNVDAAVDTANDEICSQLVEIESRELGQIDTPSNGSPRACMGAANSAEARFRKPA